MNKRRLFASAMAACMLLSTMPSTALAFDGTENSNDQSQVQTLNDGTGPAANPDTSVGGADDVTVGNDAPAGSTTPSETPSEGEETGCGETTCTHQAAIGNHHYKTLQEAADTVTGTTETATEIDVLHDIKSDKRVLTVKDGQNITLALNGRKITSKGDYTISVEHPAESGEGWFGGEHTDTGELTIIGEGTIENTNDRSSTIRNYGTLTIGQENDTEFPTIIRTDITNPNNSAVKCEEESTLTIWGGTFEGNKRSVQNFGTTNIYGGTFKDSVEAWKYTDGTKSYESTLTIKGGEFKGAVESCNKPGSEEYKEKGKLSIEGGTFHDASAFAYLADEADIKLGADITSDKRVLTVTDDQNITLDLNGRKITSKGDYTISVEHPAESGEGWFGGEHTDTGELTIIGEGTIENTNDRSSTIRNYGTLTIGQKGATKFPTIIRTDITNPNNSAVKCEEASTLTIYGGTFEGNKRSVQSFGETNIYGGTFKDSVEAWKYTDEKTQQTYASTLTIYGGEFKGVVKSANIENHAEYGKKGDLFIQGGYFTTDPTEYIVTEIDGEKTNLMALPSDIADYLYMVKKGTIAEEVAPSVGENAVKTDDLPADMTEDDKSAVTNAIQDAEVTGLNAQANQAAANLAKTEKEQEALNTAATQALTNAGIDLTGESEGETKEITLHVQSYLDMKATDYQKATEGDETTPATPFSMTLDITPMFKVIAATTSDAEEINTSDKDGEKNAVELTDKGGKLNITTTVEVTIPLPANCGVSADDTLYVTHKGYVHECTVQDNEDTLFISFENPNGFSEFTITSENPAAAQIGDTVYATLQDAVNAAVEATKANPTSETTITVLKSGLEAVVNQNACFKIVNGEGVTADANGEYCNIKLGTYCYDYDNDANVFDIVYSAPSYGGGSDYTPSTPTYTVSVPTKVQNGSVSVSSKNPTKGSTVTLTVTPDKGYELATLTVTDKDGNKIALTDKGNGKFTFTMPASKVDIKATFVETVAAPEAPVNPFYDVAETDYFFDAVLWANENGITSGVGNGQFAPNATCTRAQMVTFLWNAAGCPNVEDTYASFTDVSANDYYYKAVLWAKANGITSGTGEGVFSPDQICNRAQMATFLYKFAEGKAAGSSNRFADVTASDYYAQPVQWAVENGITSGTGADTFGPNDPCTRAQMVTFLYRLLAD